MHQPWQVGHKSDSAPRCRPWLQVSASAGPARRDDSSLQTYLPAWSGPREDPVQGTPSLSLSSGCLGPFFRLILSIHSQMPDLGRGGFPCAVCILFLPWTWPYPHGAARGAGGAPSLRPASTLWECWEHQATPHHKVCGMGFLWLSAYPCADHTL